MNSNDFVVRIDAVECIAETAKAILVEIDGSEYWIPFSQIDEDSEVYRKGDIGELVITQWIAEQNELI